MLHLVKTSKLGRWGWCVLRLARPGGEPGIFFFSLQSSALDYSATAPPFVVGLLVSWTIVYLLLIIDVTRKKSFLGDEKKRSTLPFRRSRVQIFFRAIDFYPRISLRFGIVALICIFSAAAYVFLQPTFAKTRLHHFRFDWIDSVFLIRATLTIFLKFVLTPGGFIYSRTETDLTHTQEIIKHITSHSCTGNILEHKGKKNRCT